MERKHFILLAAGAVLWTTVIGGPVQGADNAPTLQETLEWLEGKVHSDSGYRYTAEYTKLRENTKTQCRVGLLSNSSYVMRGEKDGKLKLEWTHLFGETFLDGKGTYDKDRFTTLKETSTFFLADLDPSSIKVTAEKDAQYAPEYTVTSGAPQCFRLVVTTTLTRPLVVETFYAQTKVEGNTNAPVTDETKGARVELTFKDEAMAQRVAKALKHAIELAGGKSVKEPF